MLDYKNKTLVETTGVEPVVPFGRRIYSPLGLPIFLHIQILVRTDGIEPLAATLLNNGYRVTAGNREQPAKFSHTL